MELRGRQRARVAWAMSLVFLGTAARAAPASPPTEAEVKAAFLYHFAQLVTWPDEAASTPARPLVIAVVGSNAFAERLRATVANESVRGRPLRVVRADDADELAATPDMLFVASGDRGLVERALDFVSKSAVLTVGDAGGFAQRGGMIGFRITADSRVGFDINLRAVEAAGLRMSSQLLKIARIVEPEG